MIADRGQPMSDMDGRSHIYPRVSLPPADRVPWPGADPDWFTEDVGVAAGEGSGPAVDPLSACDDGRPMARAVIGDALRIPLVWCQFGSCIAQFTDPEATGESDVKIRALAAGWQQDALGRLACPECVRHDPTFMVIYPLVNAPRIRQSPDPPMQVALHGVQDASASAEISAWDKEQPPRLNLTLAADQQEGRLAWWRHRNRGRHRLP